MPWSFALINGRLAEIFFEGAKINRPGIWGYAYVKRGAYKTKHEQKMITQDVKRARFTFRKKVFHSQIDGSKIKLVKHTSDRGGKTCTFKELKKRLK